MDEQYGDLEDVGEAESADIVTEPVSDSGVIASFLLGVMCVFHAWELAWLNGFRLYYFEPRRALDLRYVIATHLLLAAFFLLSSNRFGRWFAPPGPWRLFRLGLCSLGFLVSFMSIQPAVLTLEGLEPRGKYGNALFSFMDGSLATWGPLVVGGLMVLFSVLLPRTFESQN